MLQELCKELESVSTNLEFITEQDARRVFELFIERLEDELNSHIIDIIRRQPGSASLIMLPFISSDRKSRRGPIAGLEIKPDSLGVWPWIYNNRKPLWLQNVIDLDKGRDAVNKIDGGVIEKEYLWFHEETDEILVAPLIFKDNFMGLLSVEFPRHVSLVREAVNEILDLSRYAATILWKVEVQNQFIEDTNAVITGFRKSMAGERIVPKLADIRLGFIGRPFSAEYEPVETYIVDYFCQKDVLVKPYKYAAKMDVVIEDIRSQVEASHFGIMDISGQDPNVMIEFGFLYALRKRFILLSRNEDSFDSPFNLKPFHYFRYEMKGEMLKVADPWSHQLRSIDEVLKQFLDELLSVQSFRDAKPFCCRGER